MTLTPLDKKLKFEFSRLEIKGKNIEAFYSYCFEMFLFENSELSKREKIEAIITGQVNGKSEIAIQKVLSEKTFIQDQIIRCESYLKEPINQENREKLNLWISHLKQKVNSDTKDKLPLKQKALIAAHEKFIIRPDSGKLYQHFVFYSKRHNRISPESSRRKMINKINLFESVIPYLSPGNQKSFNDEINILKTRLKEDF